MFGALNRRGVGHLAHPVDYGEFVAAFEADNPDITLNYIDGSGERLTNGDFETGSPPSSWASVGGATLSAQAGARTGGSGTQYLRSVSTAGVASGASQVACVAGARYRATGWARGDGASGVPKFSNNGPPLWTGTNSTTWQYFSVEFTATSTTVAVFDTAAGAGEQVDFDDLTLVELPGVASVPCPYGTGYDLVQATAADQPKLELGDPTGTLGWAGKQALWLDGVTDYAACDLLATVFAGTDVPVAVVTAVQATGAGPSRPWSFSTTVIANRRTISTYINAGQYGAQKIDDAGTAVTTTAGASGVTREHWTFQHTGTVHRLWVDGASVIDAASNVGVTTPNKFTYGGYYNAAAPPIQLWAGRYGPMWIYGVLNNRDGVESLMAAKGYDHA
jgi:hypothetical protein